MTAPENTDSDPASADAGPVVQELTPVFAESNTLYVLPGDILVLPCDDHLPSAVALSMKEIHDDLGLRELIVTSGVGQPWILRKGTPADPGQT